MWISTPCRRHSWSGWGLGLVKLASMDDTVLATLVEQVLAVDELASSCVKSPRVNRRKSAA